MSVYARFKKDPEGLRQLVELLESTPSSRRQRMIDVGMEEDEEFTKLALAYIFTFEDIIALPDLELSEVISLVPPRMTGLAIHSLSPEVQERFLGRAQLKIVSEIKEALEMKNVTKSQISSGQSKMISVTRELERKGLIKKKKVPNYYKGLTA